MNKVVMVYQGKALLWRILFMLWPSCVCIPWCVAMVEGAAGALPLNLFECTSTGQRIARASLCDGRGDCLNGEDEARCGE